MPKRKDTVPSFTLGDRLRKSRKLAGLTQSDIATGVGYSRATIAAWERNRGAPRPAVLADWAAICRVDHLWLRSAPNDLALAS